jgi:hypothetical protein
MVDRQDRQRVALRWLSLCGIAIPPLDAALNAFVAKRQPGYNYLKDYASALAAPGQPDGDVLCVVWACFPLLFGPFAAAVHAGLRGHRFGRVPPVLLGLFSLFIGLCGICRYHLYGPDHLVASIPHLVVSSLDDANWQSFRRFSLLVQACGAVAAVLLVLAFLDVMPWGGFAERGYWAVYYVWFVGLGLKLRRLGQTLQLGNANVP